LDENTTTLLAKKGDNSFMELIVRTAHNILDYLLVERKIQDILVRAGIITLCL
jgi:hypothetical protein